MLWTVLTNLAKIEGGVGRDTFFSPFTEQQGDTQHGGGSLEKRFLSLCPQSQLLPVPGVFAGRRHRTTPPIGIPAEAYKTIPLAIATVYRLRFRRPFRLANASSTRITTRTCDGRKVARTSNPWIFLFKMTIFGLPLAKRSVPPKPGPDILIFFEKMPISRRYQFCPSCSEFSHQRIYSELRLLK